MQCSSGSMLCLECNRFLHLNKKTSDHERRVCKEEEEEAIKLDVHEGCVRVKLFRLLALVGSSAFKGIVQFRENSRLELLLMLETVLCILSIRRLVKNKNNF